MINPVNKLKLSYLPTGDVTQWFGENRTLYARFDLAGHNGIDIVRPHGEVMYAIEDGEVVSVKEEPNGFGKHLRIISDAKDNKGNYREWTYGHNSLNLVKQGDKVKAGQAVALMGNTGFVVSGATPFWQHNPYAGTHVHLGLREVRKTRTGGWSYEGSSLRISVVNSGNGYKGAIDPLPFLWAGEDLPTADVWRQLALTVLSLGKTVINLFKSKNLANESNN